MFAMAVVLVVSEDCVGYCTVRDNLDGAVVVLQQFGREFGSGVAVNGAIDTHHATHKRSDGAHIVRHYNYRHSLR